MPLPESCRPRQRLAAAVLRSESGITAGLPGGRGSERAYDR